MKLRTEIKLPSQQENLIDYTSKILLLGSCFSDNIGQKLSYFKFDTCINPFGTLFSPTAIEKVITDTVHQKQYNANDIVKQADVYHSLHHHSALSALSTNEVLNNIHKAQKSCLEFLKNSTHVIVTLGTSWVYQYKKANEFVANCHKIPQANFDKKILEVDEVVASLNRMITLIQQVNPSVQIIFTISPVRHVKDGMIENSISKAHLLSAVGAVIKNQNCAYYGSYEMMMDDLRDYRFYEADMIHPNQIAIDYIWKQFVKVWVDEKAQVYFKRIASIEQGKLHRPFNQDSESHQLFLSNLAVKQIELENELNIKFDA
ncbi:GSCFA domain-containing protein [Wenyingzhuangia sp. IMCC45533]